MSAELIFLSFLALLQLVSLGLFTYLFIEIRVMKCSKQRMVLPMNFNSPMEEDEDEAPADPINTLYSQHMNRTFNSGHGLDDE